MRVSDRISEAHVRAHLCAPGEWRPVPSAADRAAWGAVDGPTARALVEVAESRCVGPWPTLPATAWLAFSREGLRLPFERHYFERRYRFAAAVLAAALTGEDRFLDDVIDGAWAMCEESAWCLPAHDVAPEVGGHELPDPVRPSLDLFAAETAAALAWADHVLGADLDDHAPQVRDRIRGEVRRRVLDPYRCAPEWFWYREVPNNWNPWIHSNLIVATLLLEDDRDRQVATVVRALGGLDHHLASVPADGGCDEGVDYWWRAAASLFECLEWLYSASSGALDLFDEPYLRAAARYPLVMHAGGPWFVNFADGAARADRGVSRNGATPRLLHLFGRRIEDQQVQAHARAMRGEGAAVEPSCSLGRILPALFDTEWFAEPPAAHPLLGQTWLPRTEVLTARIGQGMTDGPFVAVKGGHNAESHNHNDVGSFVLAWDGDPIVVDAGVGEYTRRTFSAERYRIWTMRSSYHNLPQIGSWEQREGREFAARQVTVDLGSERVSIRADLAGAYPAESGAQHWFREIVLDRTTARVEVSETWKLQAATTLRWRLLLPHAPVEHGPGRLVLCGGNGVLLRFDAATWQPGIETVPIQDQRLGPVWGKALYRLTLTADSAPAHGEARMVFEPAVHTARAG